MNTRWGFLILSACTLMTACHKPAPILKARPVEHTCFTACEQERTRCNTLCEAANEECTSNAKYMAAFQLKQLHRPVNAENAQAFLNTKPCETNCGCIPSRSVCFTLCHGRAGNTAPIADIG